MCASPAFPYRSNINLFPVSLQILQEAEARARRCRRAIKQCRFTQYRHQVSDLLSSSKKCLLSSSNSKVKPANSLHHWVLKSWGPQRAPSASSSFAVESPPHCGCLNEIPQNHSSSVCSESLNKRINMLKSAPQKRDRSILISCCFSQWGD